MESLSATLGEAFDETDTYIGKRPSFDYLQKLLNSDYFIALVALKNGVVVGGIAACELMKFELARCEIYIHDLAVALAHRREGIATALIQELQHVAKERGAYMSNPVSAMIRLLNCILVWVAALKYFILTSTWKRMVAPPDKSRRSERANARCCFGLNQPLVAASRTSVINTRSQ